jgi:hypothetical protein
MFSPAIANTVVEFPQATESASPPLLVTVPVWKPFTRRAIRAAILLLALGGAALVGILSRRSGPTNVTYTQITNFTDSAVAPALSPGLPEFPLKVATLA